MMKKLIPVLALAMTACAPQPKEQPLAQVIDAAMQNAKDQYLAMAERYEQLPDQLPRSFADGRDVSSDSGWWCSGFFPGTLWYLYENSQDPQLLEYAKTFTARIENQKFTTTNHDVGFMLMSSFGNGLRITGEEVYKEVLATGARSLATRFRPAVGLIRSWDHNRDKWQYPVIIDNMMNLELLLWAAGYTGDNSLSDIALSHADSTMVNHFRANLGTYHVVSYDTLTGRVERRETHQGFADESTWARGEAWALYGYTMMYRLTREPRYLAQAEGLARFMIHHRNMPADFIPYWDFDAPDSSEAAKAMEAKVLGERPEAFRPLRDASAAAIMASALVELAGFSSPELAEEYLKVAETQVRTLASAAYTAPVGENGNFILMHSVGGLPFGSEVDVPLSYADYYFIEALSRLKKNLQD